MVNGQDAVQYGGEDGRTGEGGVQRPGLKTGRPGSSLIRRRQGESSHSRHLLRIRYVVDIILQIDKCTKLADHIIMIFSHDPE